LLIVLHSPVLRGVFLIRTLNRLGTRVMQPMLPLFVQQLVLNSDRLATITGVVAGSGALGAAAGSVFLGRASDRLGHRKVLVVCTFGMGLLYLPLALVVTPFQLGAFQVAAGFMMGGALASIAALLASRVPEGRHGAVYGVNTTIVAGANALAPMLGASIAVWWGLRAIFVVAAGLFAVGGLFALWVMPSSAPAACRSK
jgi:DHA1 family multidrug resistance protein-like MFS transporter